MIFGIDFDLIINYPCRSLLELQVIFAVTELFVYPFGAGQLVDESDLMGQKGVEVGFQFQLQQHGSFLVSQLQGKAHQIGQGLGKVGDVFWRRKFR